MTSKKDIRAQVRQAFAGRTAESLAIASEAACASVLGYIDSLARPGDSPARRGMTILLYWALPDEVQTSSLVDTLSRAGHTVLLPVVVGDELELRVYRGLETMSPGPFGILEPQRPDPASSAASSDSCAREAMSSGPSGILEPQRPDPASSAASSDSCVREAAWPSGAFTDYQAIDLAIVPGRAFTADGARLGRGRGYYDRLLPQLACPKVGLCFPWQIVPAIPMDPHDIPMDHVICR